MSAPGAIRCGDAKSAAGNAEPSAAFELVPPGSWSLLWGYRFSATTAIAAFWSLNHWAFGVEVSRESGSILLGPLALAFAKFRQAEPSEAATTVQPIRAEPGLNTNGGGDGE